MELFIFYKKNTKKKQLKKQSDLIEGTGCVLGKILVVISCFCNQKEQLAISFYIQFASIYCSRFTSCKHDLVEIILFLSEINKVLSEKELLRSYCENAADYGCF